MKELSIEEKARAYDKALEKAKSKIKNDKDHVFYEDDIIELFPQLKESEDERIRKALIDYFDDANKADENPLQGYGVQTDKAIVWLEKQCQTFTKKDIDDAYLKCVCDTKHELEKQGEQKPADRVEPKFHEGEWLCENEPNNYARFIQILETVNVQGKERYRISRDIHNDEDTVEFDFVEKYYHKFDIKDARDGDVLVHNSFIFSDFIFIYNNTSILQAYCYYSNERNKFIIEDRGHHCPWNMQEVTPATKEQHEQLEKAMADAGYTFDFDKKELKKIEQNPAEDSCKNSDDIITEEKDRTEYKKGFECGKQRVLKYPEDFDLCKKTLTAWSEEDEYNFAFIQEALLGLDGDDSYREKCCKMAEWLESLKPQNTWKPSDEQMERLKGIINSLPHQEVLYSLYQDLLKLKE